MAVVGKYAGRPLYSLPPHHRRPKAGPATQSLQRERNPKGSRRRLCALAGRGPPTETREKCRRCQAKEGDLRQKCGESVGGARRKRGTSDRNAGKVSEVPGKRRGPPTEMRGKCRRCQAKEGDLRRKCGKSVGGAGKKRGTSDGNAGKVSEVPSKREGPPTDSRGICRRSFGCQGFRRSTFTKPLISWISSTEARAFRRMSSVASVAEAASL